MGRVVEAVPTGWAVADPRRLSERAVEVIVDSDNDVYVSAVSAWEIAIKRAKGLLRFPDLDDGMLCELRFVEPPVSIRHGSAVGQLPMHHRDLFDRMLVAQATLESMTIVTRDPMFTAYDVRTYW